MVPFALQVLAAASGSPGGQGPVVTLTSVPPGGIPGPQTDSSDFFAIFFALAAIALALVVTRVVFGGSARGRRVEEGSRSEGG